jgi:hypothetical protein
MAVVVTSRSKQIEELIRRGMMPLQSVALTLQANRHVDSGAFLPAIERKVFYPFITKLMDIVFNDPVMFRLLRQRVGTMKNEQMNSVSESELDLKNTPEGMLDTIAGNVKSKLRGGGKISISDKRIASRAKSELRRRRDNRFHKMKNESVSYEVIFAQVVEASGLGSFTDLSGEQQKVILTNVDKIYKEQGE